MTRRTVGREVSCEGVALHAGSRVRARLIPAKPCTGIAFRRDDLGGAQVAALYSRVSETRLGTGVSDDHARAAVIEHLMAAVRGAEIDDLIVALDGCELPILDGDALSWLVLLESAGLCERPGPRHAIRIMRRVEASQGGASAALEPAHAFGLDFDISFDSAAIGVQHLSWTFSRESFRRDIAPARTFGFTSELDALRTSGLARGASLANTLAIDGDQVVNAGMQRFPDEFVRHKILDAIGDLALAGAPIIGRFEGRKSGHALNNALLRMLFADPANYETTAIA